LTSLRRDYVRLCSWGGSAAANHCMRTSCEPLKTSELGEPEWRDILVRPTCLGAGPGGTNAALADHAVEGQRTIVRLSRPRRSDGFSARDEAPVKGKRMCVTQNGHKKEFFEGVAPLMYQR
jgi:hypothetical protein